MLTLASTCTQRIASRTVGGAAYCFYTSRAHPKPIPALEIQQAIELVLQSVEERKTKRAEKWLRNKDKRIQKSSASDDELSPFRNQDETIELALNLNLDPRKPGQALRGSLALPHGTGKTVRIVVFCSNPDAAKAALEQGAVHAGGEELVDQIVAGNVSIDEFDRSLATQDVMGYLSQHLARILGPRGLMPNAKVGTLVNNVAALPQALEQQLAGQVQYRTDKVGIVHVGIGKGSFGSQKLLDNVQTLMQELHSAKPESYGKGKKSSSKNAEYLLKAFVTATQQKGSVKVDLRTLDPTSPFFLSEIQD